MGEPVRVLIVDDSEDDAQLVLSELRHAGYDPERVRVDGADAMRAVLDQAAWDIVICDYSMPRFSMQEAMELLRLRGLDLPFIVVSGQIGEETAVAAMKAGASDYVMKGNLPRLGPAVRREVREARMRQDRLIANRALRESEEQFRELLEAEPDVVVIADAAGKIMLVNSHVEAVLGYSREELVGRPVELLVPESSRDAHRAYRGAYGARPQARPMGMGAELVARRKDGRELPVEVSLRPHTVNGALFVTAVIRDVSERRRLEAQFRHAQKMEAVGRLAGGMAHDFNNLLTAILGFAELSIERTPPESPTCGYLEEVRKAAERAASLTRQLLAFGRRQVLEPRVLDVNTVVRDLERLLRRLIGEDVELLTRVGPAPAMVRADPGQIEQVLVNLAVNARDAMPTGGTLTIETAAVTLHDAAAVIPAGAPSGPYVSLAVRDTGTGMDANTKAHLFEPFFTTKELGRGTGLGLSTVYGIVTQSGGYLSVESESGRGTRFSIFLPQAAGSAETVRPPLVEARARIGTETILLAEDEAGVRALVQSVLTDHGYTVIASGSGDEAERLAAEFPHRIDLLVTDVVMPGLKGPELARRLTARRPSLQVLYMSGYAEDTVGAFQAPEGDARILRKPFTPADLARTVREVLDRQHTAIAAPDGAAGSVPHA